MSSLVGMCMTTNNTIVKHTQFGHEIARRTHTHTKTFQETHVFAAMPIGSGIENFNSARSK